MIGAAHQQEQHLLPPNTFSITLPVVPKILTAEWGDKQVDKEGSPVKAYCQV
ncbi:hypothetical protein [Desertivirga brevis]|uniref:hypothetical protein n=1 Tax=Desertivirga brevis TaxID=2810310 RepID=UPI001A95F27D|nr:hypothetical protein [Pedobacter sp. SYSU D00873]